MEFLVTEGAKAAGLPGNAIEVINMSIKFTLNRVDDWQSVVPEGKALKAQCQLFQQLIKDLLQYQDLPISSILNDLNKKITSTNETIDNFLKEENAPRSFFGKVGYNIKRVKLANDLRGTFKGTTASLETSNTKITDILNLSKTLNKPTIHWYKKDMVNEESFLFWKEICGENLHESGETWGLFLQRYQAKYGEHWDSETIERINRVACTNNNNFNLSGFIILTKLTGFPINVEKLPSLMDARGNESPQTRMEVAKMVNELITYYSSKEMRDWIVAVFHWYQDVNKRDKEAWQERANEWGTCIISMRTKKPEEYNERELLAEQVDLARRGYSFFFQRYTVVWKIGKVSREAFSDVDFPGKARMYEFINHIEPLDHANYHVVMKQDPEKWERKKPNVYKFLRDNFLN
ncbi:hypothetical protein BJ944DRAFT_272179 [Cunninghamella echinulata]|nr:hypothetical protein BJ944DRAFT_272179 [Cunninghamella echinulata]